MARGPASRSAETENNQLHLDGAASRKMRRDMKSLLTLLAACVLLAGCESNPITGRSQLMLVSESMAVSESAAAYSQMMGDLGKKKQIEANSARAQKVRDITDRLVAQAIKLRPDSAAWKWEVQVINDPKTVNAFCMVGGKMAIYTGMWDKLNASDDEIAMVMGHEISHALAGHTQERMSVAMTSQVLAQGVAIAISSSESTRGLALTGAQLAAVYAVQLPNSRTSESEADEIGIQLAARAGYDPKAAVTLWEKMGKLGGTPPEFLSTHPSPEHRAERLKALGEKVQPDYEAVKANPPPHQRLVNLTENARSGAVK
jgi:predicted Zn-dependent protease